MNCKRKWLNDWTEESDTENEKDMITYSILFPDDLAVFGGFYSYYVFSALTHIILCISPL